VKLLNKLTLYHTLSKTVIVILFTALLPLLVKEIASRYTNTALQEQKNKVLQTIDKNGIDYYFQGDSSYGSYTMLKEEYISLDAAPAGFPADTIETTQRIVDKDTLTYRILSHVFEYNHKKYLLEIGKTLASIDQYNAPLQRVALYALAGLILATLLIDLFFTRLLLRPLGIIIRTKLLNRKFPFKESHPPVKTTTTDFRYLDDSIIDLMNKITAAFDKEREFTSNASHELMTPISILQGKMENLMDTMPQEDAQEKIMGMMQTLNRLKKIVRSLLLISRIENDQFGRQDRVQVYGLVKEIREELEDRIEANRLSIEINVSNSIILYAVNRDLLFQLLYNLINNAIRYNKKDGSIRIYDEYKAGGSYVLTIEDAGIGIEKADLPFIFDRFKKAGNTGTEGFGIGLSIVKSIAQYHGLELKLVSEKGLGTACSVLFPVQMTTMPLPLST
jgi:two-component system sensor histidine kinase ArlS